MPLEYPLSKAAQLGPNGPCRPDLAFLPQPGLLRQYAAAGRIVSLDEISGDVNRHYSRVWQQLASVDGHLDGVWFKAANTSRPYGTTSACSNGRASCRPRTSPA